LLSDVVAIREWVVPGIPILSIMKTGSEFENHWK